MHKQRYTPAYIFLLFFLLFLYGFSNQAIGTLITRIIKHYGITMAEAGLLSSFSSAGNFIAIFVITIFIGRINKMVLLGASLFFYAASLFAISAAPPFGIILLSFALIGIFATTLDTLSNSLVADLQPANISRNMSFLHGLYGLGGLCGPIVMERLAGMLSWTQVYFIVSLAFLIFLTIYSVFVRWQWSLLTTHISNEKQTRFGFSDIIQYFTRKRHVLLWMVMFFYIGNQITLAVWIKRYVEIHLNAAAWGAYALSAMWMGIAVSRLFISPNIKASSHLKICFGNLISAVVLIAGLISGSAPGITAASLAVGLSSGLTIPLIIGTSCEWHMEKTTYGTLMVYTAISISSVMFPPLTGLIGDSLGIPWCVAVGAISSFITALFSGMLFINMKSEQ